MIKRQLPEIELKLDSIVGGGQSIGTASDGLKVFVWGGLPGETVKAQLTKKKSSYAEGFVTDVIIASKDRILPADPDSYLSTSPWQIMNFSSENHYKAALIEEAFELHSIVLPGAITVYSDNRQFAYRNKVEFSWYSQTDTTTGTDTLDLAFFKRGSKGKVVVNDCSLLAPSIMKLALQIRDLLRQKNISARQLKTLLIRCDAKGNCVWQLYVKDSDFPILLQTGVNQLAAQGGEIILSDYRSPASVITKRLAQFGNVTLSDSVLGTDFRYAAESFFQVNLPVYTTALNDMKSWILADKKVVDLYSGVGTIGLTIGGNNVTLVEVNHSAVREMQANIQQLPIKATAVLAASEQALNHITSDSLVIVDPPRAGLHEAVIDRLLDQKPARIIYLSCNPVTQARDVNRLGEVYGIKAHKGYNFFPRTPHIEHLVVLDLK